MNIQRKYSLPNCTLLLEGLTDMTRTANFQELRPELSILVNAECYLSNYNQPIRGGREFFESLVRAVSAYAQEVLSNIPNPQIQNHDSELVKFQKIDSNKHRLIVHSEITSDQQTENNNHEEPLQLILNTVQLFDLVEAVDQFFADSQTLPELCLELHPVTRSYAGSSQTLIKQAIPATIGVSSLAAAAVAFSLIPAPQVRPPEVKPETQSSTATPTATPTTTTTTTPTTTPTEAASPVEIQDLEALLKTVPEITDSSQLWALNRQVYNQIDPAWKNRSELPEDLVYRLGVAGDGSIVGYKAVNRKASDAIEKTPLPKLLYNPANRIPNEPIAQFKVVFTQKGILQVSPWAGYLEKPKLIGEKITDPDKIKDLNQKLYSKIRQNWSITPTFSSELKYRIAVNEEGVIADYEQLNQVAFEHFEETPLPQMLKSVYGSNVVPMGNKKPLAHFQVVFTPKGELQVTPWEGYR
ncbi:DUF4335 domain-containing protein [Cuspidothrix issatschenkoi LEGE 03284]|uniref:DUF4335 domain-containing protein n=1 Tax=Cuspidothrix issatschenkoi TaxID=230752 RepID=UPI001882D2E4|nr:DUF4335 domain-containing protein [Cuspidothrix issatschenkoi]MBE9231379.1 DUF4335 domain-containing protein [Cuspidothrix issatschenkoi LEGE 03284]